MKYIVLVGDGMGDYPAEALGGRTPLQAANIPNMRRLAAAGELRMVQTVPEGMSPGSDVANLDLLGYNPAENYTGRAPIEAAGAGIPLTPDDVAYRCNLVTIADGLMDDYSAGHITTEEAHPIVASLQEAFGRDGLTLHGGVSYRHLLVWRDGPTEIQTQPPHDISGKPAADYLPSGAGSEAVRDMMEQSKAILANHPVVKQRLADGKKAPTQIWLWGQGRALQIESYQKLYGLGGGVISAVDLVRGLGILAGLEAPIVPGVTGFIDTNYQGKVEAAIKVLESGNFVYVHVEAPDECGHMGDAQLKTQAIEAFDEKVVGPLWHHMEARGEPYRLLLCMDHRTPVSLRGHTSEPVPMARVDGPVGTGGGETAFDEELNGGVAQGLAHEWVAALLGDRPGSASPPATST